MEYWTRAVLLALATTAATPAAQAQEMETAAEPVDGGTAPVGDAGTLDSITLPERPSAVDLEVVEAPPETARLDDVVVTAQKRVQRLVDVPINVSSMSREDVERSRIQQVRDLSGYVPGLDIKEQVPGAIPVVSIRGIGLDDFSSTNSPAAGIYVDQVTLSSLALMSFDLYDMERIEVLKGPQGTLYGRNSTAGAINLLTRKPAYETESYLRAGYGSYKTQELEGMFNVPLGEVLALRVAGKLIRQDEGMWQSRLQADDPYSGGATAPLGGLPALFGIPPTRQPDTSGDPLQRDIGRRDILSGRVRLAWDVTSALALDLKVEKLRQRSEMGQPEQFGSYCEDGYAPIDPDHCTDSVGYSDTDRDPYRGDWRGEFPYTVDQQAETLTADWDFGAFTLSAVSGHIELERFFHIDVDGGPADAFDFFQADTVDQFTQELRLAGSTEELGDWLIGAFFSQDTASVHTDGLHQDAIPGEQSLILADQDTRSVAAFANMDWKFSPGWSITTGLRYTSETRDYVGGTTWTVELPDNIESTFTDTSISDRNWSWKLGFNYAPTARSLIYLSGSRGTKSGGFFCGVTTAQDQLVPYKPEQLTAFELGFKTAGALALNTSVFYYDYRDVQTFKRSNTAPVQFIGNVDEAEAYGLDAELIWRAFDGLTVQGGLGLLRTELGAFDGPPKAAAIPGGAPQPNPIPAGNRLANAPETSANLMLRYELPLGEAGHSLALQGDAHYAGEVFKEATNDPLIKGDAYTIYNARLSLQPASRGWEFAVWGRNLGDELYVVQGLDIGAFYFGNRNYNAPRTFGGEISINF
jgi:iron complex outermembrane recepter protein